MLPHDNVRAAPAGRHSPLASSPPLYPGSSRCVRRREGLARPAAPRRNAVVGPPRIGVADAVPRVGAGLPRTRPARSPRRSVTRMRERRWRRPRRSARGRGNPVGSPPCSSSEAFVSRGPLAPTAHAQDRHLRARRRCPGIAGWGDRMPASGAPAARVASRGLPLARAARSGTSEARTSAPGQKTSALPLWTGVPASRLGPPEPRRRQRPRRPPVPRRAPSDPPNARVVPSPRPTACEAARLMGMAMQAPNRIVAPVRLDRARGDSRAQAVAKFTAVASWPGVPRPTTMPHHHNASKRS